jgi:mannose/fructose-specific phosphotransferase system component IIA
LYRQSDIVLDCPLKVVTGVNLPMLFKVFTYRGILDLDALVELACEGGREGIFDATEKLEFSGQNV